MLGPKVQLMSESPLPAAHPALPLRMDNSALRELPHDPELRQSRRQVRGAVVSLTQPTAVAAPELLAWSAEVAAMLGLPAEPDPQLAAAVLSGNQLLPGMTPWATRYGGHQFGHWAGQLGDGRAMSLCEALGPDGQRYELQLKGAGPTPYSRTADGRAVLRSSIREFLCSEAMFHLGVPTTRALSLVLTGDHVRRDMFYDGRPQDEPGAIVCRVAPSFFRIGHLQLPATLGEVEVLRTTLDHILRRHFAHLLGPDLAATPEVYVAFLREVCVSSAALVVQWQRVGFVHGVLNTDNISLLGLTIDYGPYGWVEDFDPDWTPNTTDASGRRYRFGAQPEVMLWNLLQLAKALQPLVDDVDALQGALDAFAPAYDTGFAAMMAAKLGLPSLEAEEDRLLMEALWPLLAAEETDMTLWFRALAELPAVDSNGSPLHATDQQMLDLVLPVLYQPDTLPANHRQQVLDWLRNYALRLQVHAVPDAERKVAMNGVNPLVVPRNWLVQQVIDAAESGESGAVMALLEAFRHPYAVPDNPNLYAKRPEWARVRAGCSMLSCSS